MAVTGQQAKETIPALPRMVELSMGVTVRGCSSSRSDSSPIGVRVNSHYGNVTNLGQRGFLGML